MSSENSRQIIEANFDSKLPLALEVSDYLVFVWIVT